MEWKHWGLRSELPCCDQVFYVLNPSLYFLVETNVMLKQSISHVFLCQWLCILNVGLKELSLAATHQFPSWPRGAQQDSLSRFFLSLFSFQFTLSVSRSLTCHILSLLQCFYFVIFIHFSFFLLFIIVK